MPSRGYHTARLVCTRRPTLDLAPLAPPVGICDGWRAGEVPERPKGHAWRACVPTRYRGFEPPPLRLTKLIWGPVQCSPRVTRLRTNPRAGSAARPSPRRLARRLSAPASLCLAPSVQGGYCTACPAGVGRWRLGPAQEG